jgi:predicted transcriptional regulator
MKVGECCKHGVVSISGKADILEAACLMRDAHVGFLVVFDQGDNLKQPIRVLTDRDIVLEVLAREVGPRSVRVEDVMTREPLIARASDELTDLVQGMRLAGVRRVPVVDDRRALSGVVAVDDAIDLVTRLLCDLSGSIKGELRQEWRARRFLRCEQ